MIKGTVVKAINEQINMELFSAYLYQSMVSFYEQKSLKGFAHWNRMQVKEELFHAQKFFDYVLSRGGKVVLASIDAPENEWASPLEAFTAAYEHEKKVSASIDAIIDLAKKENDHASEMFLDWYVNEQVEEEANASEVVEQLKLVGDGGGLFMVDRELAKRPEPVFPVSGE